MRCLLNDKKIASIKPCSKRQEFWDLSLPGFGMRVTKNGQKTFFVMCRDQHRQRRVSLGRYPIITLSEAREAAREKIRTVAQGIALDIKQPKIVTVEQAVDQFIELYAKKKNKDWQRGKTRLYTALVQPHRTTNIRDIKREDIIAILDRIVGRDAPIQANRVLAGLSKFFRWCVERSYIENNPALYISKPSKENPRDRVLSEDELVRIWTETKTMGYPFGPLLQILLLTAQRKGEVAGLRWSEINFKDKVWTIPKERSKNKNSHLVPLTDNAVQILQGLPRFLGSDLVFTTTGKTSVSGFGRVKANLDKSADVQDWIIHDIRRTVASGMARLKVPPYTVEKILNHVSGTFSSVTGVYNRYGYDDEKRAALQIWDDYISGMVANGKANKLSRVL